MADEFCKEEIGYLLYISHAKLIKITETGPLLLRLHEPHVLARSEHEDVERGEVGAGGAVHLGAVFQQNADAVQVEDLSGFINLLRNRQIVNRNRPSCCE